VARSDAELENGALTVEYELAALVDCYRRLLKVDEDQIDPVAANAFLEAMLVHGRCLIEFIAKSRNKRDIHRHDYLPGWEVTDPTERDQARSLFRKISKYLSHLSWKRAEVATAKSPTWSYSLAYSVVKLFEEFAVEVRKVDDGKPWVTVIQEGTRSARRNLPPTPRSGGATTTSEVTVNSWNIERGNNENAD
jgi:hypothetical protein